MTNSSNGTLFPFEPPAEGMFILASNGMQYYGKENYRAHVSATQDVRLQEGDLHMQKRQSHFGFAAVRPR